MDDSKVTLGDDEFHFSEAEETSTDPYALTDDATEPKASKLNRRNILIAIGIIVVALSLYKLIGVFFGASDSKKSSSIATATTPVKAVKTANTSSQATLQKIELQSQAPTVQIQTRSEHTKKMQNQLSQMQKVDAAHTQQMQQVSSQISSLAASVDSLKQSVQSMNQSLQSISSQVQTQQASIAAMKVKSKPRVSRYVSRPVYRAPRWYVQAIIPGRAWLEQTNGNTITVNVGDVLKGYGKIKSISVVNGTVKLSSGAILTYRDS